ncbi:MAG: FliH/SctL family protein [Solirubrobacterales bacterium]
MSKIIKSRDLIFGHPVTIESRVVPVSELEEDLEFSESGFPDETGEHEPYDEESAADEVVEEPPLTLVAVQEEADNIIRETEQMVVEILEKARSEAAALISDAREEALVIKQTAEEEAAGIRETAARDGYEEGNRQIREEMESERIRGIEESEQLVQSALQERMAILASCEDVFVSLSMAIARKVIERELSENHQIIIDLVRNIVDVMSDSESIKVLVNTEDFERLAAVKDQLAKPGQGTASITLQPDDRITPGGCIAESDTGIIDAQIETRIANVENALMEVGRHE